MIENFVRKLLEGAEEAKKRIGVTVGFVRDEQFDEIIFDKNKELKKLPIIQPKSSNVTAYFPHNLHNGTKIENKKKIQDEQFEMIILENKLTSHLINNMADFQLIIKNAAKDYISMINSKNEALKEKQIYTEKPNLGKFSIIVQISLFEVYFDLVIICLSIKMTFYRWFRSFRFAIFYLLSSNVQCLL